jgi:hypothetical protein
MQHASRRFREELRRELPRWQQDGLVSPDAAAALWSRYRLAEAEPSSGPGLLPVYVLGALLVGAGVVSLVAWHWEEMGPALQLAVIGAAMVASHGGGLALWRGRAPRLGHALTLLGTVIFGANVGLVAQIFHVSGVWWGGFAAFAAGALAAGVAYPSLPHLLLGAVLGLWVAGPGLAHDHPRPGLAIAWALAVALVALAWRERSRALAVVSALGLAIVAGSALDGANQERGIVIAVLCLAAALCATPLAAAPFAARSDTGARLSGALRVTGRLLFYGAAAVLSFTELAHELRFRGAVPALTLLAAAPAAAFAIAALATGLRRPEVDPLARGEAMLVGATVVALAAGLSLETGTGTALVANLALAFLAAGRIVRGLSGLRRAPFWEGMAVAGALTLVRFISIETGLWLKGAGFIACGAAVLLGGSAFERRRARAAEVTHAA